MSNSDNDDIVWLASFDIGKKNFSFYIEEVNLAKLKNIQDISKNKRYLPCGTPTPEFQTILDHSFTSGKKILLENVDLTIGCDKSQYLDPKVLYNMIEILDEYDEFWSQCDVFIIEKQMSFGRRYNTMALKIGQHCWSYFAINYGQKKIEEFPAYHKTQVLGATKTKKISKCGKIKYMAINKPSRKKWCIQKALTIMGCRQDNQTISQIQHAKKKDDLCDVICQVEAYKVLTYITQT